MVNGQNKAWNHFRDGVNGLLWQLGLTYHESLPLSTIEAGVTLLGGKVEVEGIYCGRDGHCTFDITYGDRKGVVSFNWHKMEVTGHYEVVAYVA